MRGKTLSREQRRYIVEHINDKTATEIAEVIGCSKTTVNSYALESGARKPKMRVLRDAEPEYVQVEKPKLHSGQIIDVPTKEDKSGAIYTRSAEVVETYEKFCILQVEGKNGGQIRVAADYFDLATKHPIVI